MNIKNSSWTRVSLCILVIILFLIFALSAGLVFPALAAPDYNAWRDLGIVYAATAGNAYYPSVLYDPAGFGSGNPAYRMWYSDGNGLVYLVSSQNGVAWGAPAVLSGLGGKPHHVQVLYNASCFGASACNSTSVKYKIWYWDENESLYDIRAIAYAESADGIAWNNFQHITQASGMQLVTGGSTGWNRGSYGPISLFYQPGAANTGSTPWNYSYVLYYDGTDGSSEVTGLAYSADGLFWTAFSSSPVLDKGVGNAWDCDDAAYGTVYHNADGYHFWYSAGGGDNGSGGCAAGAPVQQGIGYAFSSDGLSWTKAVSNPIFSIYQGISYRSQRVYTPAVVDDGSGILKMYYSAVGTDGVKKIGLAVNPQTPNEVWVDDNYTAIGNNDGHIWGYNAFSTISGGVSAVAPGGTVYVAAGTYTEAFAINKPATLLGPNAGISPNNGGRAPEAIVTGSGATNMRIDTFDPVVIDGFEFQNVGTAIDSYQSAQIVIRHNIFQDTTNQTFYFGTPDAFTFDDNLLFNLGADFEGLFIGGDWNGATGTVITVTNNTWKDTSSTGMNLSSVSGLIANNQFINVNYYGFLLANDSGHLTISGNLFDGIVNPCTSDISICGGSMIENLGSGIRVYAPSFKGPVLIQNNSFHNSYSGIGIRHTGGDLTGLDIHITNNSFFGNTHNIAHDGTGPLDASENWWGTASPSGVAGKISGSGSTGVDYTPWLGNGINTSPALGFQGDFSSLWVEAASQQTGSLARIQEAVNLVTSGGVITATAGTYNENPYLNKSLTLRSASGAAATILDGNDGEPYGVFIASKNVTLDGFTVTNPGYSGASDASGIVIEPPLGPDSNIRIAHNSIHDVAGLTRPNVAFGTIGINIGPVNGVEIDNNDIYNIQHSANNAWANGISVWGNSDTEKASNVNIHNNKIYAVFSPYSSDAGISAQDFVQGMVVYHNSLTDTGEFGVENRGGNPVNAIENWWGSVTGPTNSSNPAGTGERASDHVTFTPWLCNGTDTSPATGFQPQLDLCTLPTHLVFSTQPGNALTYQPLTTQPVVQALDAGGNLVTDFSGVITVTIGTNPAGGIISGTTALAANHGIASFSGISIDKAGLGYRLAASSPDLSSASSMAFNILNPTPHISDLSPQSIMAGSQAFLLTVYGDNFVYNSVVRWNGSNRPTIFVSSTELIVAVRVQDVALSGTATVTVFNPTPGGSSSNGFIFPIGSNPLPEITNLSPDHKTPGEPDFILTVSGLNFIQSSVVRWNGANRPTYFIKSTELMATIPAADIEAEGVFHVTVSNPTPGGGVSNSLPFVVDTPTHLTTADLAISLTDGLDELLPGSLVTYTIVVTNNGPDPVTGAVVSDTLPAILTSVTWTCTGSSGSQCSANGSGNLHDTVNLLNNGVLTYRVTGRLASTARGVLFNTATVAVPPGVTDPDLANNRATHSTSILAYYHYLPLVYRQGGGP